MKGTWPLTPTNLHFYAGGGKRTAQLLFFSNIKSTLNIVCFSKFFVCPYISWRTKGTAQMYGVDSFKVLFDNVASHFAENGLFS